MKDTDLATFAGSAVLSTSTMERLERLADREQELLEASKAANTWRGYRSDWRQFAGWCRGLGVPISDDPETLVEPIPVTVVRAYVLEQSERLAPKTVQRHLTAIKWWSNQAGFVSPTDDPTLRQVLEGVNREAGNRRRQAAPLYLAEISAAVAGIPGDHPKQVRDRALLVVGWWGAFRRSELVGIDREHLEDHPDGIIVTLPRSKTDQTGQGRQIPLHYRSDETCPVRALRSWLEVAGGDSGPVFVQIGKGDRVLVGERLGAAKVSVLVKAAATRLGLDPAAYSAHSLRAGFVSECDRRRIPTAAVRAVTGHTSEQMLSSYARPGQLFDNSAGAYFNGDETAERSAI